MRTATRKTPLKAPRRCFKAENFYLSLQELWRKCLDLRQFSPAAIKSFSHPPDAYAASAAVSHNLSALPQVDSKRNHSSRLSVTCEDKEKQEKPESNQILSSVLSMSAVVLQQQTSARWPMITCQIVSSSAGDNLPRESKYCF